MASASQNNSSALLLPPMTKEPRAKFAIYLHRMVTQEPDDIVKWTNGGTSFKIMDMKTFIARRSEYKYKGADYAGFKRQLLKYYSFSKIGENEYQHRNFRMNEEALAATIPRAMCSITSTGADRAESPETVPEVTVKRPKAVVQCSACECEFTDEGTWPVVLDCGHVLCNLCWDDWSSHCRNQGEPLVCLLCKIPSRPAKKLLCH